MTVAARAVGARGCRRRGLFGGLAAAVAVDPVPRGSGLAPSDELADRPPDRYGTLLYTLVGVVVLWNRPGHGIGRVVDRSSDLASRRPSSSRFSRTGVGLPGAFGLASQAIVFVGWIAGGSLLVVWFPDGHRTSRLGGLVEVILLAATIGLIVTSSRDDLPADLALGPVPGRSLRGGRYRRVRRSRASPTSDRSMDLAIRYRRADVVAATQMRWVLAAEAVSLTLLIAFGLFGGEQAWSVHRVVRQHGPAGPGHRDRDHPLSPLRDRPDRQPVHHLRRPHGRPVRRVRG